MKKYAFLSALFLFFETGHALPLGNPTEASLYVCETFQWDVYPYTYCYPCLDWLDCFGLRFGFYGDYVFNRHMKVKHADLGGRGGNIDTAQWFTNAGYLVLNFFDRIDFFSTLGCTSGLIKTDFSTIDPAFTGEGEGTHMGNFSWSVGGRATLLEWNCFGLGIEGQYFHHSWNDEKVVAFDSGRIFHDTGFHSYKEWQVGGGVSYRFAEWYSTVELVPYVGAKWSWAQSKAPIGSLNLAEHWGYAVGMTLTLRDCVGINVEGRFGDEKAVAVTGQMRF